MSTREALFGLKLVTYVRGMYHLYLDVQEKDDAMLNRFIIFSELLFINAMNSTDNKL